MSEIDKEEIAFLEREYYELYVKESRERKHRRYLNAGAIVGIIFVLLSSSFEKGFYKIFGTLGMGVLNSAAGLCFLMSIIFLLPGVRDEDKYKWKQIEIKRKKLDELKSKLRN